MFEQVFVEQDYGFELPFTPRTIIDAGANAGFAALFFAHRYSEARILALEPDAENFALLRRNVRGHPQINTLQGALWGKTGEIKISDSNAPKCMISVTDTEPGIEGNLPAVTVVDLAGVLEAETIDLLKIDIEGAEREVFASDVSGWLPRTRAIMIELHDRMAPGCAQTFYKAIEGAHYLQYSKGDVLLILFPEHGIVVPGDTLKTNGLPAEEL